MIKVTVQTQDRLNAINNLCLAIRDCARALSENVIVNIYDNDIRSGKGGAGITLDTSQAVKETKIFKEE